MFPNFTKNNIGIYIYIKIDIYIKKIFFANFDKRIDQDMVKIDIRDDTIML